jgi:glucose-fructose oxidoreductase
VAKDKKPPIRFAVVGLGWFAQAAVLPAFKSLKNAELSALVSGDGEKLAQLGKRHKVKQRVTYDGYDELLASGEIDAVYLVLPNSMHAEYTVRAAKAGVHVLCEKPMATSERECRQMIEAARAGGVKLMIGYRLHFEAANLAAVQLAHSGKLGELRHYEAAFAMPVEEGNSRLSAELGGGPLNDIGIYCINAARYLFGDEPTEVFAIAARKPGDPRFGEVDEQVSAVLRFPKQRTASFTASFGAAGISRYDLLGDEGRLRLDPAFHHASDLVLETQIGKRKTRRVFKKRDQVAAELAAFVEHLQAGTDPSSSGLEGLADVRIIAALNESIATGLAIPIVPLKPEQRPSPRAERRVAPHGEQKLVRAEEPRAR